MRPALRIALQVLPWLLCAALAFLAWLAWIHFQWKDRTLWERILDDVERHHAQLADGDPYPREPADHVRLRLQHDCAILEDEAHLAPATLAPRVEAAAALCR